MDLELLEQVLSDEPVYRVKQAREAIFKELVIDWNEARFLPSSVREKLIKDCSFGIEVETLQEEKDVIKVLLVLEDGLKIETVLMRHNDSPPDKGELKGVFKTRNTVCVSSQVGCALGCKFCSTGKMGFKRDLTVWEIVFQVLFFANYLKKEKQKVTNVVFMGMGEPFLNYDNVLKAIRILNSEDGFNIGARNISVSTSGVVDGINKLAEEKLQINLAISLHASDNETRSKLMPINQKYPLNDVLVSVDDYIAKTNRKVMFEYIMIDGVNDSDSDAQKLAKLMRKKLYFVNLIPYNQTGVFKPSPQKQITKFKEILEKAGVNVSQRYHFGGGIKAACGQLAGE